jgi:tRNA-2-methylthio-N6-dimethylallyladenosine synthase
MYFTESLVDAIADLPSVCEHLHLPMQSGDNTCLKRMKRTYTVERYKAIIDRVRDRIPGVTLTTDAIVGFCGETDEEFENTMQTFRDIRFDQAFMFAYSPRHTTEAFDWPDDVPHLVKKERLNRLIDLQADISREKNGQLVGQKFEVLVEGPSDKDPLRLAGRTRGGKLMIFAGQLRDYPVGTIVEVEAREGFLWGFTGDATRVLSAMPLVEAPRVLMELQMAG